MAHRVIIWVFAVLHDSTGASSNKEGQRTDPTRYLQRLEVELETRAIHSQSGYASFMTSANPAIPTQKVSRSSVLYQHRCTYLGHCNSSDKTKPKASGHELSGQYTNAKPTLSPTCISFMRFLASGFRTPSHGVDPADSKSSTLNLSANRIDELSRKKATRGVTHFNILPLHYAGVRLCLHKPKLGHNTMDKF